MLTAPQRAEMLALARELIAHGWTQHAYVRSDSGFAVAIETKRIRRVCGAGAIDRIGIVHGLAYSEREQLRDDLVETLALDNGDDLALERWNDEPGRTRGEVLDAYDATIARLIR